MPKFDSTMFSEVEYDFSGFRSTKTGEYLTDKGVIPEPDRHLVGSTMKRVSEAFKKMKRSDANVESLPDEPTPAEVKKALDSLSDEDMENFSEMADEMVQVIADFCQGHPTYESLDALSWPKFMAFFGYLMEHMLSPEASTPGTNDTPRQLRSV